MYLEFGHRRFDVTFRPVVVGSVNGGSGLAPGWEHPMATDTVLERTHTLVAAGADAVDLGGLGPLGSVGTTETEELERLVPVVEAVRGRFDVPLWISTWRRTVAAACFDAGANVAEDRSGLAEPGFLAVCAAAGASVVLATVSSAVTPLAGDWRDDRDAVGATCHVLVVMASRAEAAGIPAERIMVDPRRDPAHGRHGTSAMVQALRSLATRGYRVVLSSGVTTSASEWSDDDPGDAGEAAVAIQTLGVAGGCRVIRTPDVRTGRRVGEVLGAVLEHR
jgi:dihydropteroate synthase